MKGGGKDLKEIKHVCKRFNTTAFFSLQTFICGSSLDSREPPLSLVCVATRFECDFIQT
jgi:hypothetical protein